MIYFESPGGGAILATYVVIPPIAIDFSKYLPPMFAAQGMASNLAEASSVVPLPPVPETIPSLKTLRLLAEQRDDDLISAGEVNPDQVEQLLLYTNEAAQLYFHMYEDFARTFAQMPAAESVAELQGPSPEELEYALMGERDRLGELAKLAGVLRYAVEGNDQHLASETLQKMELLAKHIAPKYWTEQVIDATKTPGRAGGHLSQLYIDRCYKLLEEDYSSVAEIEKQIEQARR